ncbi:MAG: 4-alpha-glucanotransferase [Sphingobacteriales bacterium]|jgi:4-alpha-glucanotransferase
MTIRLLVRFSTSPGQSLFVAGSMPLLGHEKTESMLPMRFLNTDFWEIEFQIDNETVKEFSYHYVLAFANGEQIHEWGDDRKIEVARISSESIESIDTWNHAGSPENAFFTSPFQDVLLPKFPAVAVKPQSYRHCTHLFQVKAPLLEQDQVICLLGNHPSLCNWDTTDPIRLYREGNWWIARIDLKNPEESIEYKYGVFDVKANKFISWEGGLNRILPVPKYRNAFQIIRDGFIRLDITSWKGAGIALPVFSLRSENSSGTGEFSDIRLLTDWAKKTGLKLIQILPVNDTTSTHTWMDSYPYSAISAFALHPLFINLKELAGPSYSRILKRFEKKRKALNELSEIDYEGVMNYKWALLQKLFELKKDETFSSQDYHQFFEDNKDWLIPYAAFSFLRDKYGTADFRLWKKYSVFDIREVEKLTSPTQRHYSKIAFHYFLQYHLHIQLKDAHDYANKNGIIIKGDIPIGVNRNGVDTWMAPELYHMHLQAGAPPDDFAVKGQNWAFPTYNWDRMKQDEFKWWKRRFEQMSRYFDAFRIDHILGFFRIWSIPEDAVEGVMGHFVPAIPIRKYEFEAAGIYFDEDRFCKLYITDALLWEMFGPDEKKIKRFIDEIGNGQYTLKNEFNTQKKVEAYFESRDKDEENLRLKNGLFDLLSNLILFSESRDGENVFHFRFNVESTYSFKALDQPIKEKIRELYIDYFFRRQDDFWKKEAMEKLPALKKASNMLICGEDLGLVPDCVPSVMEQLGFLSLELQRMPKKQGREFELINESPYLSVVTPSTHDMSTLRGWWEEDRGRTQRFFHQIVGQQDEVPHYCEAWINKEIILQHLNSPAMWAVFQLQDIMGIDEHLRRSNPHDERINVPANPKHYWRYRMHVLLEDLLKNESFNLPFSEMVKASGRA